MVHDELTGLARLVEVHDDEVVDLDSVWAVDLAATDAGSVVLQEELAALAVEAEVLEGVDASREAQQLRYFFFPSTSPLAKLPWRMTSSARLSSQWG